MSKSNTCFPYVLAAVYICKFLGLIWPRSLCSNYREVGTKQKVLQIMFEFLLFTEECAELTQIAFKRLCASGVVESSFSFPDGKDDQKKFRHSASSKIYGKILDKSRTQFNTACCSACVLQLLSTACASLSVAL